MEKEWEKPELTVVLKVRSEEGVLAVCKGTVAPFGGPHKGENQCFFVGADCKALSGS